MVAKSFIFDYTILVKPGRLSTPIFVYEDYVEYLDDWYRYARRFGVTARSFVQKAGIGAHAFLSDVISRRKKIGESHIDGFVVALELVGDEALCFKLLVEKELSRDPAGKEAALRKLAVLRERNLSAILDNHNLAYFASWRYPVIREFAIAKGVIRSVKEITESLIHLKLSSRDVDQALRKLTKWGMLLHDAEKNEWRPNPESRTVTYTEVPHAVVNDVKRTLIETSVHAMETMNKNERHVSMAIKGISPENYHYLCGKIDDLRREFLNLSSGSDTDRVAAMTIQLFPLIKVEEPRKHTDHEDGNETDQNS